MCARCINKYSKGKNVLDEEVLYRLTRRILNFLTFRIWIQWSNVLFPWIWILAVIKRNSPTKLLILAAVYRIFVQRGGGADGIGTSRTVLWQRHHTPQKQRSGCQGTGKGTSRTLTEASHAPEAKVRLSGNRKRDMTHSGRQCWGSGSGTGSAGTACFGASRIPIHKSEVRIRIRILPIYHKYVERTEIISAK